MGKYDKKLAKHAGIYLKLSISNKKNQFILWSLFLTVVLKCWLMKLLLSCGILLGDDLSLKFTFD